MSCTAGNEGWDLRNFLEAAKPTSKRLRKNAQANWHVNRELWWMNKKASIGHVNEDPTPNKTKWEKLSAAETPAVLVKKNIRGIP